MIEMDFQQAGMKLQQQFEDKLRLPVVVSQSGTAYVLDSSCVQAEVLKDDAVSRELYKRRGTKMSPAVRLFLRYPEVPVAAAKAVVEKISSDAMKPQSIHIIIDTGIAPVAWPALKQMTTTILNIPLNFKIPARITIYGVFTCPDENEVNWLTSRRIFSRYILGPALGYAADLDAQAAKSIEEMANQGLRVPLLYYWSGQGHREVAEVLNKALRLNKLAGVGILPYFLSPRFNHTTAASDSDLKSFSELVGFLYADRFLSEYLEEPVSDIEARLAGLPGAHSFDAIITEDNGLLPFRRFSFAAADKKVAPLYGQCKRCVWRGVCGGIDSTPPAFRNQYKIIADAWCSYRKHFIRQFVRESLEIREHLGKIEDRIVKEAKV